MPEDNGGSGATPEPQGQQGDQKPPEGADDLTRVREALEKERMLRKEAERKAKEGDTYRSRIEELEAASKSDLEKAVDAARKEGESAAAQRVNERLVKSEARALAAQAKFRDAGDAVHFLDLADVKVADDGTVDAAAITKQLDQLAKDKPYLLSDDKPPVPTPGQAGIGVTGAGGSPSVSPGMGRLRQAYANSSK